jgi:hypothetical protein
MYNTYYVLYMFLIYYIKNNNVNVFIYQNLTWVAENNGVDALSLYFTGIHMYIYMYI